MSSVRAPSVPGITSYKGEYLWINHDKEHREHAKTQRSKTSSHLRNRYWKRQHDATIQHGLRTEGLSTILRRGNSDPFNAMAIPIDPTTNEMMTFLARMMAPKAERAAGRTHWHSYDWGTSVSFLHDESTALAQFAHIAVAMDPQRSFDNLKVLSFKSGTMNLLRARVSESRIMEHSTCRAIYLLLMAEVFSRNFAAAFVHASLLARLLHSGQIQETFSFVFWVLGYDYQRAAMSQSRLCLDIEFWIPTHLQTFWHQVLSGMPNQMSNTDIFMSSDVDINTEDIQSLFTSIQQAQFALSMERTMNENKDKKSIRCRAFWTWTLARLHHSYLDAIEALEATQSQLRDKQNIHLRPPLHGERSTSLRVTAFFSLAAHIYTRISLNVDTIRRGEITVFSANAELLLKLRDLLADYERNAEPTEKLAYGKIQLWALYIGAYAEQAAEVSLRGATAEHGWFNTRLATRATSMGLLFWPDVRAVLQIIHYTDSLRPHGSQWFWKIMNANATDDQVFGFGELSTCPPHPHPRTRKAPSSGHGTGKIPPQADKSHTPAASVPAATNASPAPVGSGGTGSRPAADTACIGTCRSFRGLGL